MQQYSKLLGDVILVKITKEAEKGLLGKEITRNDGTIVTLYTANPVKDGSDGRTADLFHRTALIVGVGEKVKGIAVGDMAIIDSTVTTSEDRFFDKDETGTTYSIHVDTTYVEKDLIAYASQKSPRDKMIARKGEYEELSPVLGFLLARNNYFLANAPYVFLEFEKAVVEKSTLVGITYEEKQNIYKRKVFAVSEETADKYHIFNDDTVLVGDLDVFDISFRAKNEEGEGIKTLHCVNDMDILAKFE